MATAKRTGNDDDGQPLFDLIEAEAIRQALTYIHSSQTWVLLVRKPFRNRRDPKGPTIGLVSGRLMVEEYVGHDFRGQSFWRCRCTCGTEVVITACSLRPGGRGRKTKSCGCLMRDHPNRLRHGEARVGKRTTEFKAWISMRLRCKHFTDYIEKGIKVCERWDKSYEAFLEDMGRKPTPQHTIDRIKNSKGYEPGNCRWATRVEQGRNKTDNCLLTCRGKTQCLQEWSEEIGINPNTVRRRLRGGRSVEESLFAPVLKKKRIVPAS